MKKIYLLLTTCFAINLAFAQEKAPVKPSAECLKVAEFNRKIAPVKQADKIYKAEMIHIRGKRPVRIMQFDKAGLKNFEIYKWLMSDTSATGDHSELGSTNALASDRLYMEMIYIKGGKVKAVTENINFCENKNASKPTRPSLKFGDKGGDGKNCLKVSDFKSKLQGMPQADSVTVTYTLLNAAGEEAIMRLNTMQEVKQFNVYNWLSKGAEVTNTYGETGDSPEGKKIKAQPGDLVQITLSYSKNGQEVFETNQFPVCKP